MLKYAKVINEETGRCDVGFGTDEAFYKSLGMTLQDVSQSNVDDCWYLSKKCPMIPEEQKERKRLNQLNLTKADFWIALLDRDITKAMVKAKIELIPDETLKAKTLIRLDEADHFWRGDPSMDVIGAMFGITPADLDYLFENKALPVVDEGAE